MKKAIATLLTTALGLALLIYSGLRSLDFVQSTLPADQQILAYFALAATEGGIMFWLLYFLYAAKGGWQRAISVLMLVVDFLGAVALFTADTLLRSGQAGIVEGLTQSEITQVVYALSGVIALNVAGTIGFHVFDTDNQKTMATEEARDKIEQAALKQLGQNADALAADLAPMLADAWSQQLRAQLTGETARLPGQKKKQDTNGSKPVDWSKVLPWLQSEEARTYSFETKDETGERPGPFCSE